MIDIQLTQDPRPDLQYDSMDWTALLSFLERIDPDAAGVLHGFRCGGLRLHRGSKGYALRPEYDPMTSIWADEAAYKADRNKWLLPHTDVIVRALKCMSRRGK